MVQMLQDGERDALRGPSRFGGRGPAREVGWRIVGELADLARRAGRVIVRERRSHARQEQGKGEDRGDERSGSGEVHTS